MAGSLPDIMIPQFKWTNVYQASGIAVGRPISIQNKSTGDILVFESKDAPDQNSRDGDLLAPKERTRSRAGSPGVWVMSRFAEGRAFIQDLGQ